LYIFLAHRFQERRAQKIGFEGFQVVPPSLEAFFFCLFHHPYSIDTKDVNAKIRIAGWKNPFYTDQV
jgi:hypothetical protein